MSKRNALKEVLVDFVKSLGSMKLRKPDDSDILGLIGIIGMFAFPFVGVLLGNGLYVLIGFFAGMFWETWFTETSFRMFRRETLTKGEGM